MNKLILFLFAITIITMTSCGQTDQVVTIKTSEGDMVAILYDETPKHKENFLKLANEHFYDGLLFHRVMQGFMIQGGDPNSKTAPAGGRLGNGGPGYTIEAEILPKFFHEKGALAAARLGDQMNPKRESSGSQFYVVQGTVYNEADLNTDQDKLNAGLMQYFKDPVNKKDYDSLLSFYQRGDQKGYQAFAMSLKPKIEALTGTKLDRQIDPNLFKAYSTVGGAPALDGQYTVFGKVIKGLDVIDKIAALPRDQFDRPVKDVRMTVTVEEMPRSKVEELYGYKYP